jgi:hypothetical protein
VDVQEVRKLDAYFKKLFGNSRIRVVPQPRKDDLAEVFIGEEKLGDLNVDDEDDERSYNFRMEIDLGQVSLRKRSDPGTVIRSQKLEIER